MNRSFLLLSAGHHGLNRRALPALHGLAWLSVLFVMMIVPPIAPAQSDAVMTNTEPSTVRILGQVGNQEWAGGSGFIVASRYVATNWHVVAEMQNPIVILGKGVNFSARVVSRDEQKDLAVLQLPEDTGKAPVKFSGMEFAKKTETVYALGFPARAENEAIDLKSEFFEVDISKGIIRRTAKSRAGANLYEIDAAINPGNSGGPLANECGEVIGISEMAALVQAVVVERDQNGQPQPTVERIPSGSGIAWAISSDELIPELRQLGLEPQTAIAPCSISSVSPSPAPGTSPVLLAAVVGALVLGSASLLVATKRGRATATHLVRSISSPGVRQLPPPLPKPNRQVVLHAVSGDLAGQEFVLDDKPLLIGRDPTSCQLVFPETADLVSKRHCLVRYDPRRATLLLEDSGSTNGTFLQSGERLKPGSPQALNVGDRFYVGDARFMFEVKAGKR